MRFGRALLTSAIVTVAALALAGQALAAPAASTTRPRVQHLTVTILPSITAMADERVPLENVAIEPGIPVRLVLVNHTRLFHTFTVPELHVSALVGPAHGSVPGKTTVTFTTYRYGVFDWDCVLCPHSHGQSMTMGGKIYSIIGI